MFKLREVTGARDASYERIKSLEVRLESVTKQNEEYEDQNRMLKGMLKSLSKKVQGMYAEHEAARQTLAARSLDLKSIVASSDVVLERARVQSETMLHTKIDIQNILHFVNDESDDTSDTKSTGSCSSSDGSDVTPRV
jgi:chromosome segregation ATPase